MGKLRIYLSNAPIQFKNVLIVSYVFRENMREKLLLEDLCNSENTSIAFDLKEKAVEWNAMRHFMINVRKFCVFFFSYCIMRFTFFFFSICSNNANLLIFFLFSFSINNCNTTFLFRYRNHVTTCCITVNGVAIRQNVTRFLILR